ncbi:MAG TPA: MFS transporter [Dehalococcoidia bacterium]|nr:MFS transporter [Dehalococcoidia bacterium]
MKTYTLEAPARKLQRRWLALAVMSVSIAVLAMDTTIVNVAIPAIQQDLGASASSMQWIIDAYYLVFAGLLLTMGAVADRWGRRLILQMGMVCFAGASLFAAYAQSSEQLILARALTGVGAATVTPATLSIIVDTFPRHERAKAIAIWSAAAGIGVPLGQITAGALLARFWWGSIFFINVPVCAVVFIGSLTVVSESRDPQARPLDPVGALLSTVMLSSLVFGIIEAPSRGWTDPVVVAAMVLSVVLALAFVACELRARFPMLDVRLLEDPALSMSGIALIVMFLVMLGMMFLLTQYLQLSRGHSALETGFLMSPLPLGFALGSAASERAAVSFGANRVTALGLALSAAALAALSLIGLDTRLWTIELVLLLFGLGGGAIMAPATAIMMEAVPETVAGVGGALNEATRVIGMALGVSVLGSISNAVFSSRLDENAFAGGVHLDSLAAAMQASRAAGPIGANLNAAAQSAFMDSFSMAMVVGAGMALAAAPIVLRWMPRSVPEQTPDAALAEVVEVDEGRTVLAAALGSVVWEANTPPRRAG